MNIISRATLGSRCHSCRQLLVLVAVLLISWTMLPLTGHGTTLQDLFNGAMLDVGSVRFSDWTLQSIDSLFPPDPDFTQIDVLPLNDDPLNPGIQLVANGQLSTLGFNAIDLLFSYRVSSTAADRFAGDSLELDGFDFSGTSGIMFVSGELADGEGDPLASSLVTADKESDFFLVSGGSSFASQEELQVLTNVLVTGLPTSGQVNLNSFTHRFSLVPEPSCLALLFGLVLFPGGRTLRCASQQNN